MTDIDDLIARLEAAPTGDSELDARIHCFVLGAEFIEVSPVTGSFSCRRGDTDYICLPAYGQYTRSIDAALTLVPAGFPWAIYSDNGRSAPSATVIIVTPDGQYEAARISGFGNTPPLALCIAALKARQGSQP